MAHLLSIRLGIEGLLTHLRHCGHLLLCLVLVQHKKTGKHPNMTEQLLTGMLRINTKTKYNTEVCNSMKLAAKSLCQLVSRIRDCSLEHE